MKWLRNGRRKRAKGLPFPLINVWTGSHYLIKETPDTRRQETRRRMAGKDMIHWSRPLIWSWRVKKSQWSERILMRFGLLCSCETNARSLIPIVHRETTSSQCLRDMTPRLEQSVHPATPSTFYPASYADKSNLPERRPHSVCRQTNAESSAPSSEKSQPPERTPF